MGNDIIEKLYREHSRKLYLYIFSLCRSSHLAADLVQETFVKALLSLPEDGRPVVPWLYKVAYNLTMDAYRSSRRLSVLPQESEVPDFSAADSFIRTEENQVLYHCIQSLGDSERRVITLFYFSGFSLREIAAILGCPYSTVRVTAARARDKLRAMMEKEGLQ